MASIRPALFQQRFAFGDQSNQLRYGMEHETERPLGRDPARLGRGYGIVKEHRPVELDADTWQRMGLRQRSEWMEAKQSPVDGGWPEMIRTESAPTFLAWRLWPEASSPDTLEAKSKQLATTLFEFLQQVNWAKVELDPSGRTQYNIGFRNDPRFAREVALFAGLVAEYATLRMISGSPLGVSNRNFGMYTRSALQEIEQRLRSPQPELGADYKGTSFALRSGKKYGAGTVVGELRAITNNVPDARRVVFAVADFLENPRQAQPRLGRKSEGYRIGLMEEADVLSWDVPRRLPMRVQTLMRTTAEERTEGPKTPRNRQSLVLRWAIPMVKWEQRPGIPSSVRQSWLEARSEFESAVRAVPPSSSADVRAAAFDEAVHRFAATTQVHNWL